MPPTTAQQVYCNPVEDKTVKFRGDDVVVASLVANEIVRVRFPIPAPICPISPTGRGVGLRNRRL